MAIAHIDLKPVQRSKGHSAVAAASYRAGERHVDPRTGEVHDYRRRRGVIRSHSRLVFPHGQVPPARGEFWGRVEKSTNRSAAVVARHFDIALPHELSVEQQCALLHELAESISTTYGVAVDVAHHEPEMHDEVQGLNWHGHLLMSTAAINPDGSFGRKVDSLDPIWCKRNDVSNFADFLWPVWIETANRHLEAAGCAERIVLNEGAAPIPVPKPSEEKLEFTQHRFDDERSIADQQNLIEIRRAAGNGLRQLSSCGLAGTSTNARSAKRFDPRVLPGDARARGRAAGVLRRSKLNPTQVPGRRAGRTKPQEKHTHRPRFELELEQQIRRMESRLESLQGERIAMQPLSADEDAFLTYQENLTMSNHEQLAQIKTREEVDELYNDNVARAPLFAQYQKQDDELKGQVDFKLWLLRFYDVPREAEEEAYLARVTAAQNSVTSNPDRADEPGNGRLKWVDRGAPLQVIAPSAAGNSVWMQKTGYTRTPEETRNLARQYDIYEGDRIVAQVTLSDDFFTVENCSDPELAAELALNHAREIGWDAVYIHGTDDFRAALLRQADGSQPPIPIYDRASGAALNDAARTQAKLRAEEQLRVTVTSIAAASAKISEAPEPIYPLSSANIDKNNERLVSWWRSAVEKVKTAFQTRWGQKTDAELDQERVDRDLAKRAFAKGQAFDPVTVAIAETNRERYPNDKEMVDYLIRTAGATAVAFQFSANGQPVPEWPELCRLARDQYELQHTQLEQDGDAETQQAGSHRPA